MTAKIQVRRDTAANWTSNDPTLASGEIGFETDTNLFKIGTNVAWTATPYPQLSIPYLTTALTDLNTITVTGRYRFTALQLGGLSNKPSQTSQAIGVQQQGHIDPTAGGSGSTDKGATLIVLRYTTTTSGTGASDVVYQEITTYGDSAPTPDVFSKKWYRIWDGTAWQPWVSANNWAVLTDPTVGTDVWCRRVRASSQINIDNRGLVSEGAIVFRGASGDTAAHMYMPNSGEVAVSIGGTAKQTITATTTTLNNAIVVSTGNSVTLNGSTSLTVGTGGMVSNGTVNMSGNGIINAGLAAVATSVPRVGQITGVAGGAASTFNPMISIGSINGAAGSNYSQADVSGIITWSGNFGDGTGGANGEAVLRPSSGNWSGLWWVDNGTVNQNINQVSGITNASPATTGVPAQTTRHAWIMFKNS